MSMSSLNVHFAGQAQKTDTMVAGIKGPTTVKREAFPWKLPRRPAIALYAMTTLQAIIMVFGPARAAKPSSKEVFKVIRLMPANE